MKRDVLVGWFVLALICIAGGFCLGYAACAIYGGK
jgi:hypothetical protein